MIASGIVPPGIEGSGQSLADLLARLVGPGHGHRARQQRQRHSQRLAPGRFDQSAGLADRRLHARHRPGRVARPGRSQKHERRLVAARAILGEWLGGSGGGWQDSGGVWPGIKLIEGAAAERGRSRVRHQPRPPAARASHPRRSRTHRPRRARSAAGQPGAGARRHGAERRPDPRDGDREVSAALRGRVAGAPGGAGRFSTTSWLRLRDGDIPAVGAATTRNFFGPIQTIIPWASNLYTETLIEQVRAEFGADFWGFWMLGGMSGGGMGFIFAPARKAEAQERLQEIMSAHASASCSTRCPSRWSRSSTTSRSTSTAPAPSCCRPSRRLLPPGYYALIVPRLLRLDPRAALRIAPRRAGHIRRRLPHAPGAARHGADAVRPPAARGRRNRGIGQDPGSLLAANGFDRDAARADPRRSAPAAASASRRTGCPPAPTSRMCEPGDVVRRRRSGAGDEHSRERWPGRARAQARSPSCRWPPARAAAGRRAQAWSRRCIRSPSLAGGTAPSSRCTSPRAAASGGCAGRRCRTSSPPAI